MKWYTNYSEWEAACKKREGFEGPFALAADQHNYQFVVKSEGTVAMWNGKAGKGSIFGEEP